MKHTLFALALLSSVASHSATGKQTLDKLQIPLVFEGNAGQTASNIKYLTRTTNGSIGLTENGMMIVAGGSVIRSTIAGSVPGHQIRPENKLATKVTYHRADGDLTPEAYAAVRHAGIYPGIDLIYHGNQRKLEYDFEVAPNADTQKIRIAFDPETKLSIDANGDLMIQNEQATLRQQAPIAYQEIEGSRRNVPSSFHLASAHEVAFSVGAYDHSRRLVIDPVLTYSTYLGGQGGTDMINDITVDSQGYIYVTGSTSSPNFPAVNSQESFTGSGNAFVAKISPDGSSLIYSTFFGQGNGGVDMGNGVVVDANGNAFITGYTCEQNLLGTAHHAYLGKLNPDGSVNFFNARLTGHTGDADEQPTEIRLTPDGNIVVSGSTMWDTVPVVNGYATFAGFMNGFVIETDPSGSNILYSTYVGTRSTYARSLAVDSNGFIYVTGNTAGIPATANAFQTSYVGFGINGDDAYVVKIDPRQTGPASIVYATYLGGWDWDSGNSIAVDANGNAWITGETRSTYSINPPGFPVTPSAFQSDLAIINYADTHCYGTLDVETCEDAFVAGISADGSHLLYSSYLGGSGNDRGTAVTVDPAGRVWIAGTSCGIYFPITGNANQSQAGTCGSGFVAIVDPRQSGQNSLVYSSFLGGRGGESVGGLFLKGSSTLYVAGTTHSTDYPVVNPLPGQNTGGGTQPSGFVSVLSFSDLFGGQ